MTKIIVIVLIALTICYVIYGWYRMFILHLELQQLAQLFPIDFRMFVEDEEGWVTYDQDHNGKGCIKLIPSPQITHEYYYYIKFTGPTDEDLAIRFLIRNFKQYMHVRGML